MDYSSSKQNLFFWSSVSKKIRQHLKAAKRNIPKRSHDVMPALNIYCGH